MKDKRTSSIRKLIRRLLLKITLVCFLVYLSFYIWQAGASLTLEGHNTGQNCRLLWQQREGSPLGLLGVVALGDAKIPIAF